ncbi:MAG: DUF721 domain-containing protein [Gemmatimonadota bacterium]
MAKPNRPTPIAEALQGFLAHAGLVKRLQQAEVIAEWETLVGPQIAAVTQAESVTPDGVLRVRVATAPWANELRMMTPGIIARLNGGRKGRIEEIRWIVGTIDRPGTQRN